MRNRGRRPQAEGKGVREQRAKNEWKPQSGPQREKWRKRRKLTGRAEYGGNQQPQRPVWRERPAADGLALHEYLEGEAREQGA